MTLPGRFAAEVQRSRAQVVHAKALLEEPEPEVQPEPDVEQDDAAPEGE